MQHKLGQYNYRFAKHRHQRRLELGFRKFEHILLHLFKNLGCLNAAFRCILGGQRVVKNVNKIVGHDSER